jgi:hypothetical protein
MKFVYHGHHEGEKIGVSLPRLDGHGRPLINPSMVQADSPLADFIITADRPFVLNHKDFARGLNWVCDWLCAGSNKNVRVLDRELLPPEETKGDGSGIKFVKFGVGIEFPARKKKKEA